MMSLTQKTLLYANIPTTIYSYTLDKQLRDRFGMSPITYPAITVSFLSEGIKKYWNTFAPIRTVLNATTQEYDSYYGAQDVANISLTVWSLDEDELREICHGLELYLRLANLNFVWATDHLKVTGVKSVQLLTPYADEFLQEHSWRAVIDFTVEYLWEVIDLDPAIRAYQYLFKDSPAGSTVTKSFNPTASYMPGSWGMDILIKGWKSEYTVDALFLLGCSKSYSMDIVISS